MMNAREDAKDAKMKKVNADDPETLFERVTEILETACGRVVRSVNQETVRA